MKGALAKETNLKKGKLGFMPSFFCKIPNSKFCFFSASTYTRTHAETHTKNSYSLYHSFLYCGRLIYTFFFGQFI
ncbi:hypothetical protein BCR43DRAFT_74771 [Syncephalastrum racemosum]|uniref:Uncharacterized protein n=1 Tax=Syncephalastrum racemosum TaxID=13706 RepID=A0A1X2H278_SYNRA|nr:hypothetical protein BCR43DRAFT_74771 [Syncephalastrum racemosum]